MFGALSAASAALAALAVLSAWFLLFLVPCAIFGYIALILALTMYRFAPNGGDLQRRIHELLPLPYPLRHPKVLGRAMLTIGNKQS